MVRKDCPLFGNLVAFSSKRLRTSAVCVINVFCLTRTDLPVEREDFDDFSAIDVVDFINAFIAFFVDFSKGAYDVMAG